jgi:hypothetical protein
LIQKDCLHDVLGIPAIIFPLNYAAYDYEGWQPQRYPTLGLKQFMITLTASKRSESQAV